MGAIIFITRSYANLLFDIKGFYPFIQETLLHEAIQFAKKHVIIATEYVENKFYLMTESRGSRKTV